MTDAERAEAAPSAEKPGQPAPGRRGRSPASTNPIGALLAGGLVLFLAIPLVTLLLSASPGALRAGAGSPLFGPALLLSLRTTLVSVFVIVVAGTPLAWWIATSEHRLARVVEVVVDLPIVIPPAVVGVALLQAFGRQGILGPALGGLGIDVPFTERAVLAAQIVVSAPFFIQAAANAFRKVDPDTLIVARSLGASSNGAFFRVAVPIAAPGLVVGTSLAWARALGEFGATLLFAGNLPGRTQTMPLAILTALESDVRVAIVFSLVLTAIGSVLLVALRLAPSLWSTFAGVQRGQDAP